MLVVTVRSPGTLVSPLCSRVNLFFHHQFLPGEFLPLFRVDSHTQSIRLFHPSSFPTWSDLLRVWASVVPTQLSYWELRPLFTSHLSQGVGRGRSVERVVRRRWRNPSPVRKIWILFRTKVDIVLGEDGGGKMSSKQTTSFVL